jgi:hypothetical protein
MNRVIDLDDAARAIAQLRQQSANDRLRYGPITWRDERSEFNDEPFEEQRSRVTDPFSLGVQLFGRTGDQVGGIVLFRGGWADVWVLADGRIEDASVDVATLGAVQGVFERVVGALARN